MRSHRVFVVGLLVCLGSPAVAQTTRIDHQGVACAVAERFPRLEAGVSPLESVAIARVLFQGTSPEWYSVAMKVEGGSFVGVLPKPKKSLKAFRYYIEVTDKALGTTRTPEFSTTVIESSGACRGILAGALSSASLVLQGPAGIVAIPAGFASTGVVAGSAAGTGSAAGAAGAGGGIGATALVVGGLAAAGGAVALALPKGGDSGDSSSGPSGSQVSLYDVSFLPNPPGIDVSVCAGRPLTWSSQNVSADSSGNFNQTWAVNEPNTARVSGQVTATMFQATLACTNGARTGSITASGSGGSYSGTFSFGPSNGQVSIRKQQ